MKNLAMSPDVLEKLREKHNVSLREVEQCFENKCGLYLEDDREEHRTDPATLWFVAPTNRGRPLKVIFIFIDGTVHIKTAYEPIQEVIDLYERHAK
ncbi:ADP-ribosyl-[dinitrogen reductase] hydrolase [Polaromonas sp. JS666]|uniref:ADP-ribosyl-[dinitrogen reductase] hydrolase n=1 Tax=Polaromonas sp. (strain JS666 / ATCC BAA-500) TaxID=296591 RepID=UPI00059E1B98|nr:ADP-ribosyl-[dinitrogen reductase] hydrolase [Polaromonas sp. JS666]